MSPKKWIEATDAIGIVSKAGRYGGTYAHSDIAMSFATWISSEFQLYIMKDYRCLKTDENSRLSLNWNLNREISKLNYGIHTDAVKENLISPELTPTQVTYVRVQQGTLKQHNEKLANQQSKLDAHQAKIEKNVANISKIVTALKVFKEKLEGYKHLTDIDKIWNDCKTIQNEIRVVSDSITKFSKKVTEDITTANNKNKSLSDQVNRDILTLHKEAKSFKEFFADLSEKLESTANLLDSQIPVIKETTSFAEQLKNIAHLDDVDSMWEDINKTRENFVTVENSLQNIEVDILQMQKHLEEIDSFVAVLEGYTHLQDIDNMWEDLDVCKKNIEKINGNIQTQQSELDNLATTSKNHMESIAILSENLADAEEYAVDSRNLITKLEVFREEISALNHLMEKQLNCWKETEREQDETVEQMQILNLRKRLREGEPCPVCGSTHFLKEESLPEESKELVSEVFEKLEMLKKQIEQAEEALREVRQEYSVKQNLFCTAQEEQLELEKKTEAVAKELEEKKNALQEELSTYGIQSLKAERERIKAMDLKRESLEKERSQMQKNRAETERQFEECESVRKQWEQKIRELELSLLPLREKLIQKQEQIKAKIGGRTNPNEYLKLLQNELSKFRTQYQEAKQKKENAEILLKQCEEACQICNGTKLGNEEALQNAGSHLERELKRQDFADREEVRKALLSVENKERYKREIESYGRRMQQTKTQLETIQNRLNGRSVDYETYEETIRKCEVLEEEKKKKEELKITLHQEISRMEEHLKQQEKIQKELSEIEHRLAILEDLRSVTRGKRFVEFLATERLRYISKSASKRLYEITNGNYELEINAEGEFIIRDNKNGGVLRQTATLSGGETFVTSLALALALSAEIQLKGTAPLELFFLDEGFGSLDDTLLDVVMESLEKIHNEQLKVGIISHVESVKARVPVRLIVTPAETGVGGSRVKIEYS